MQMNVVVPEELMHKEGHYLYLISSTLNDRVYVGITSKLNKRINTHSYYMWKGVGYGYKSHLYASAKKYGLSKFTFSLVSIFDNREDLNKAEIDLIAKYKSDGVPLYNLTNGGEGSLGWIPSDETRDKMSAAKKGKYTGENHPNYGKTPSAEARDKMSAAKKGKYTGENSPMYGKTFSAETRAKMSEAQKGKTYTDETRAKLREAMTKYPPELIASFPNQKAANLATGISGASYSRLKKIHPHLFIK
jgi:group I intron endonuclease